MQGDPRKPYIIAIAVALFFAGSAAVYKYGFEHKTKLPSALPIIDKVGSDHAHASLLIMVGDRILNFCSPDYMLKSQYVHFEDNNCSVVHRHARGVTIPTFLKTIGVGLTPDCLTTPADQKAYGAPERTASFGTQNAQFSAWTGPHQVLSQSPEWYYCAPRPARFSPEMYANDW